MSDWYSRALQRANPSAPTQAPRQAPPSVGRWQGDRQVSTPAQQQQVPDEFLPVEMRWANKLVNAARNAIDRGQAHKTDKDPCPQCGSPQFFSRAGHNKRMPPPAPHCYNCGYNDGMFEQGLEGNWVGANP